MAYPNLLVSVPVSAVARLNSVAKINQYASAGSYCSHLIAYWVEIQPLGQLLGEALDGGDPLPGGWRHRFRVPKYHPPASVTDLFTKINAEWELLCSQNANICKQDDWYALEIGRVMRLFEHASNHGEAVVSYFDDSFAKNDE